MRNIVAKIGEWVKRSRRDVWFILCAGLVAWSAYNVGLIRGRQESLPMQEAAVFQPRKQAVMPTDNQTTRSASAHTDQRVVVSKTSSSKKYHFSWCPGASKIKDINKIWFDTAQAAEEKGYSLAGNCRK